MRAESTDRTTAGAARPRAGFRLAVIAVLGAAAIWAGAQVTVPMEPVPMTLQTLAVLVVGGLGGPLGGAAAGALYLALGLAGAPIFADGTTAAGLAFLDMKSGGYVVAFAPAAALAGMAGMTRRRRSRPLRLFGTMLAAHALILTFGGAWLAAHIGASLAIEHGVTPFLLGAAGKSLAAALVIALVRPTLGR